MKVLLAAAALLMAVSLPLAATAAAAAPATPLVGSLGTPELWQSYKAAFVSPGGRVIDNANGNVSHSEGQGYGMILAVAANDRDTFATLWAWTRSQLMLRDDGLAAWRWDPNSTPHVADRNTATDGDILIAWALAEAGDAWGDAAYRTAALELARAVADHAVVETSFGPALKPGVSGFGPGERPDGPVVNLSYWVFPALAKLAEVAPDRPFPAIAATGLRILDAARFGPQHLPADWIAVAGKPPVPAKGFPARYGYDAIRIPLYLAWAGQTEALKSFGTYYADPNKALAVVDLSSGAAADPLTDSGYQAVAALTRCATRGTPFPPALKAAEVDRYYPSTLRAFALIAARQAGLKCD